VAVDLTAFRSLRLSTSMRAMILNPVDRTYGGKYVIAGYPRRTNYALQSRNIIDNMNCLTSFGNDIRRWLLKENH